MKYALVDSSGLIQNVIHYDGSSTYTPPEGTTLQQVNDWLNPGDHINTPEPGPATPSIENQILSIEGTITPRILRGAISGDTKTITGGPYNDMTPAQAIASAESQIAALRSKL